MKAGHPHYLPVTRPLTEKAPIMKRWVEHFGDILNQPSTINNEARDELPQFTIKESLANEPTPSQTIKAIGSMSSRKEPGTDALPAEI